MSGQQEAEKAIRREHDAMDDFEHLVEDVQEGRAALPQDKSHESKNVDDQLGFRSEHDAMTHHHQPSSQGNASHGTAADDPKAASILLLEAETHRRNETPPFEHQSTGAPTNQPPVARFTDQSHDESPNPPTDDLNLLGDLEKRDAPVPRELPQDQDQDLIQLSEQDDTPVHRPTPRYDEPMGLDERVEACKLPESVEQQDTLRETTTVCPSVLPMIPDVRPSVEPPTENPTKSKSVEDDSWSVIEKTENVALSAKSEQPTAKEASDLKENNNRYEMSNDFVFAESPRKAQASASGESEFESEPEVSPAKSPETIQKPEIKSKPASKIEELEIAPKEIFRSIGIDAWFNPERLNPKVAALIYWRDPKKSGIVFGAILGVLLSLAYFSLISVLAYLSLIVLLGTVTFRIYKTVLQAVQKTSDGHPFKDILEADLTVPAEKVHEVADVAVAYANAAVIELRRLFLVEDFVDSVKFGVVLWSTTYVGSWFNGMTLIIIGVVALFTLPKVYETNKAQVDQNLALVQGKINELTAKVKAAIPLGKKPEPTKEE